MYERIVENRSDAAVQQKQPANKPLANIEALGRLSETSFEVAVDWLVIGTKRGRVALNKEGRQL